MSPDQLSATLGRIARIVAETLELKDVLARVAQEAKSVLPLDAMWIARQEKSGGFTLHSSTPEAPDHARVIALEDVSSPFRPALEHLIRFEDVRTFADTSFFVDKLFNELEIRSSMITPLKKGDQLIGCLAVDSRQAGVFTPRHEPILLSIADLLVLALEHERLWNLDMDRRRRMEALDGLLPVIAQALDVGKIFEAVSRVVSQVLQHDHLLLLSTSTDGGLHLLDAYSGEAGAAFPRSAPMDAPTGLLGGREYEIIPDFRSFHIPHAKVRALVKRLGVKSSLRVPVYLEGGPESALNFLSKNLHQYSEDDVPVARRVADLISLALSHKRLAEEAHRAAILEQRVDSLQRELEATTSTRRIVGRSRKWKNLLAQVAQVAPTETTVLLVGESGTGKEVLARMIHRGSPRASGPFKAINCAALPETLLESELFGHEKGAFTGASDTRFGCIEQAAGGVLFLDEVGEMSLAAQAKLLRVLEQREFTRLGGVRNLRADVRLVAATNRDLKAAVVQGLFRQDLYYRLRVFEIAIPPLRERADDILPISEAFLDEMSRAIGCPAAGLSGQVIEALKAYPWPGNVRELRNVLERASILCDGGLITLDHLPPEVAVKGPLVTGSPLSGKPADLKLAGAEKQLILDALERAGHNLAAAARLLGISRPNLYYKMKKYGLEDKASRRN